MLSPKEFLEPRRDESYVGRQFGDMGESGEIMALFWMMACFFLLPSLNLGIATTIHLKILSFGENLHRDV